MSLIPQVYAETTSSIGVPQPSYMQIDNIGKLISSVISLAFILAGVLTFAFLVWGGIDWLTSGGDKTKTEGARNRITAALVGLAIVAASYAIMKLISYFFGIDFLGGTSITLPRPF